MVLYLPQVPLADMRGNSLETNTSAGSQRRSPAKGRVAVIVVLLLFVGFALFAWQTYVEKVTAPPPAPTDERLVWVGGKTILRNPEQLGHEMTDWFHNSQESTLAFELSDQSFAPDSTELSPIGQDRVNQIAELLKAQPRVTAHIENPIKAATAQAQELDRQRAEAWKQAIVGLGVDAARLTIEDESEGNPTARSSQLVVTLSK